MQESQKIGEEGATVGNPREHKANGRETDSDLRSTRDRECGNPTSSRL